MQRENGVLLILLIGIIAFTQPQGLKAETNVLGTIDYQIQEVKAKIKHHPKDDELYLALGYLYSLSNRDEDASVSYQKALKLNSENPKIYYFLAEFNFTRGKLNKGEEYIRQALKFDPNNKSYLSLLGFIFARSGEIDKALGVYKQLFLDPEDPLGAYYLASLYEESKDLDKAILYYKKAAENLPNSVDIYEKLVYLYDAKGDKENVQNALLKIKKKDKKRSSVIRDSLL